MIKEILFTEEAEEQTKRLPKHIQRKLKEKIELLLENPLHPSLHLKRYHQDGTPTTRFYLVAIGAHDILEKFKRSL